jgi:hypothetical protein
MKVPAVFRVPAPVKVRREATPAVEKVAPVILIVPVDKLTVVKRVPPVVPPRVRVPVVKVPAPTAIVLVPLGFGRDIVVAPEIVREFDPLIVTAEAELTVPAQVKEEQTAAVSTVTLIPLFIVQVSPATGTADPPQVAVLLQLPETEAVLAAARAEIGVKITNNKRSGPKKTR